MVFKNLFRKSEDNNDLKLTREQKQLFTVVKAEDPSDNELIDRYRLIFNPAEKLGYSSAIQAIGIAAHNRGRKFEVVLNSLIVPVNHDDAPEKIPERYSKLSKDQNSPRLAIPKEMHGERKGEYYSDEYKQIVAKRLLREPEAAKELEQPVEPSSPTSKAVQDIIAQRSSPSDSEKQIESGNWGRY